MRWRTSIDPEPHRIATPRTTRAVILAALGLGLAAVTLWSLLALGAIPGAQALTSAGGTTQPIIEATHLPPLLNAADDNLSALRYDIECAAPATELESSCDIEGTVYVRLGGSSPFRPLALAVDGGSGSRYTAALPADVADSVTGFSYYATIRDRRSGTTVTLPAGGASAPQRSLRLTNPINIDLGAHHFGSAHQASARVASASWGDGVADVGIEEGPQLEPIGASSFDVDATGTVTVLDEAHKRLLRFASGAPSTPSAVPVGIRGTIADLAALPNGSTYILESVADSGENPLVRSFDAAGHLNGTWHAAEPTVSTLRIGATGPQALEYPAAQWMPIAIDAADASGTTQLAKGRSGRAVAGGREIVAQREGNEARVALVGPTGVVRSWRIRSATPLAEIQLAETLGDRVVLVLRTYTDTRAAFVVLVLNDRGLEQHLSIDPSEWAEAAPLSRFRLVGSSLFHLGSTPTGMFVDRFDLEVH
jgi:hypothetical protein